MASGPVQPKGTGSAKQGPGRIMGHSTDNTRVWFPSSSNSPGQGGQVERVSHSTAENFQHASPAQAKRIAGYEKQINS